MPRSLRLWPAARRDLDAIWLSIAEDSLKSADAVLDRIAARLDMLGRLPEAGRRRDDLHQGLRYCPLESYLIFYSVSEAAIEVRRVLHGARNILPEFFED